MHTSCCRSAHGDCMGTYCSGIEELNRQHVENTSIDSKTRLLPNHIPLNERHSLQSNLHSGNVNLGCLPSFHPFAPPHSPPAEDPSLRHQSNPGSSTRSSFSYIKAPGEQTSIAPEHALCNRTSIPGLGRPPIYSAGEEASLGFRDPSEHVTPARPPNSSHPRTN